MVAIAASFVAIVEGLSEFDVNKALIHLRHDDRELFDSAWTLSVLRGFVAAVVMILAAPIGNDPRIQTIVMVLAICPILHGLSNPQFVTFERSLVYSRLAIQTLAAKTVSFSWSCPSPLSTAATGRSFWGSLLLARSA